MNIKCSHFHGEMCSYTIVNVQNAYLCNDFIGSLFCRKLEASLERYVKY